MKTHWFAKKGWFYVPVSPIGWLILIFTNILIIHDFMAVDRHSHSVSDTYYGFLPYGAAYFFGYCWIASNTAQ